MELSFEFDASSMKVMKGYAALAPNVCYKSLTNSQTPRLSTKA